MQRFISTAVVLSLLGLSAWAASSNQPRATAASEPHLLFEQRLAMCTNDDASCKLDVAAWAAAFGLLDEADSLYRNILQHDPMDSAAYEALLELAKQRSLPAHSETYHATRALLDDRFVEYQTRRFIVLSNADAQWTRTQAEHLERAYHQFIRFTNRLNLRPLPLQHKLVCVLFEHHHEYRAFARTHDDIRDPWILGYYSPRHDRVVFYHRGDDDAEQQGVDEQRHRAAIATTIHEAIHQLHFHTRVKSLHVQYPLWICEGIATAFETDLPNQAFGPDHEFQPRRERFNLILREQQLMPLRQLVSLTALPADDTATVRVVYHQSYALVTWLHRFRHAQLREYLNSLLTETPGEISENRHWELFEVAFGRIETLERRWLNHERQLVAATTNHDAGETLYAHLPGACLCHTSPAADAELPRRFALLSRATRYAW